jgi:hypothetical protein
LKRSAKGLVPTTIVALVLVASWLAPTRLSAINATATCSYVGAPTVTGINPTLGPTTGGTSVVITGCGFTGAVSVHFGATSASFTFDSDTQITATSPAHAAGTVDVTVTNAIGTSTTSTADQFTYSEVCQNATLTPDKPSPQPAGTVVTYTAGATGCSQPVFTWYFQVPGGSWYLAKNPSTDPTLVWNTTGAAPGTYNIDVWISQNGSATPHETFKLISYAITIPSCVTASYTADKASSQQTGTIITFTATSSGCPKPEYKWYVQSTNGTWTLAQNYSSAATFAWNTAGLPVGTYHVNLWARQQGDSTDPEAFSNNPYTLIPFVPCTGATLTPDKASPQPAGTVVTYTAGATGCSQPSFTWYFQAPGGSWYLAKNPSTDPTLVWNTTGAAPGIYHIDVWISQNGSPTAHETFTVISYTIS